MARIMRSRMFFSIAYMARNAAAFRLLSTPAGRGLMGEEKVHA